MKQLVLLITLLLCVGFNATPSYSQATEICNNNLDDDGDGLIDCRDGDCPGKVCEICDDQIDNDGDGFIDCFDKECTIDPVCEDFFLGNNLTCEARPDSFPPFEMRIKYRSNPNLTNHLNRLVVGDVDNDGSPEIVSLYRNRENADFSAINILQAPGVGSFLNLDRQIDIYGTDGFRSAYEDIAMADINKDGCAEIFILTSVNDGTGFRTTAYDCNGNKIWATPISHPSYPGNMGLADFDGDGAVELYIRTRIYDAHSGTLMGQNNTYGGINMNSNGPLAVDIHSSPGLELVAGCRIFSVSINRPAMPPAIPPSTSVITEVSSRNDYFIRTKRTSGSATSVADYNQDGYLDILAVGSLYKNDSTTTIFFWDVHNNTLRTFTDLTIPNSVSNGRYRAGWDNGAGRINIADIDGDTLMNAVYVSGRYMYALDENLNQLWREEVTEETSGYTGCTMFDFNADGKSEIVYRDEDNLYIFTTVNENGTVTVTRSVGATCKSRTAFEYPIVADIDADGAAEICVTCATDESVFGRDHALWDESEVRVYESANEPWVPARRVWNQHGYFVVNVNDDLTIPPVQQLHHLIYAKNVQCIEFGITRSTRPLNTFLNQSPYLNSFGCPSFAAPNLVAARYSDDVEILVQPPTCPETEFSISFKFANLGDVSVRGQLPITFYNGDPTTPDAIKLETYWHPLQNMLPGDTVTIENHTLNGPGSEFPLFIVINDNGEHIPFDSVNSTVIRECFYGDNILRDNVIPGAVPVIPVLVKNNFFCPASEPGFPPTTDNGAVKAYVQLGSVQDSVNFDFYWTNGNVDPLPVPADHQGYLYTGLPADTYKVYAIHKTANCSSDTSSIEVITETPQPTIEAFVLNHYDNCEVPTGELSVVINGGEDPNNFNIYWWAGPDIYLPSGPIGTSETLTNLTPGTYSVVAVDKRSGCSSEPASPSIADSTIHMIPAVMPSATDIVCSDLNSGSVTVTINAQRAGDTYAYHWYRGSNPKPTPDNPDTNVPTWNDRPQGNYTVVVRHTESMCESEPQTVVVDQTTAPVITVTKMEDQIGCDPQQPTGAAEASVAGDPANFTYQWYRGQASFEPNAITGATSSSIDGLSPGFYAVKVTDITTGCDATEFIEILSMPTEVIITQVTPSPATRCDEHNGGITVTMVTPGALSDYDFEWYNVTENTAITATGPSLTELAPGDYTVKAIHRTLLCESDVMTVTVIDNIVYPEPFLVTSANPAFDCSPTETGTIEVDVSSAPATRRYAFEWYEGGQAIGTQITADVTSTDSYPYRSTLEAVSGNYTVKVTDIDNNCSSEASQFLPFVDSPVISVTKTDIFKCEPLPGGQINVSLTPSAGFENAAQYSVYLFSGSLDPGTNTGVLLSAIPPAVSPPYNYQSPDPLDPGYYTIVAVSEFGDFCRVSASVELERVTTNPVINSAITDVTPNMNCDATNFGGSGAIELALGAAGTDNPGDYSFAWEDLSTGAPLPSTNINPGNPNHAIDLAPGRYRVTATFTTPINEGCSTTRTFSVLDEPEALYYSNGSLTTTTITHCDPADGMSPLSEGSATFVNLTGGSTTYMQPFPGFNFVWFSENDSNTPLTDNDATTWNIGGLPPGDYFAVATNGNTNCDVTAPFTIINETLHTPQANLVAFGEEVRCIEPTEGFLEVEASPAGGSYTFEWFDGANVNAPVIVGATTGLIQNNSAQRTLDENNVSNNGFTLRLTDNNSNCWTTETYYIPVYRTPIVINTSTTPLTNCVNPDFGIVANGSATAWIAFAGFIPGTTTPRNVNGLNFTFQWTNEDGSAAAGVTANGRQVLNSDARTLNLEVIDNVGGCPVTTSVEIMDLTAPPPVEAYALVPMTNCDDENPNGIGYVSVNGNVTDYIFDWFEGEQVTPVPPGIFRGNMIGTLLRSQVYTALATSRFNGCSATDTTMVQFVPTMIPVPQIEILSHMTSCVEDNGALTASVAGQTAPYIFQWYDGQSEKSVADFEGVTYNNLHAEANGSYYSVIATDRITLCRSPLVSEIIHPDPTYPDFVFELKPESCEQENGSIKLFVTNDVQIGEIIWETDRGTMLNTVSLDSIPAGRYRVTVVSQLGCPTSKDIELTTDVRPFNGISRNGDALNAYFHINCIDNFPNNIVKIFNRAGTLVYVGEGYDNQETFFDGQSNKGITVMGNNLPDGTYFYVIDKRDGSKPLAGYLEIIH